MRGGPGFGLFHGHPNGDNSTANMGANIFKRLVNSEFNKITYAHDGRSDLVHGVILLSRKHDGVEACVVARGGCAGVFTDSYTHPCC